MNNNGNTNSRDRSRSIVTPAQRKAEQEKKAAEAARKSAQSQPKSATPTPKAQSGVRTAEDRRRDIERRRNGADSVSVAKVKSTAPARGQARQAQKPQAQPKSQTQPHTSQSNSAEAQLRLQQEKLREQQKQIEELQNQIREKNEKPAKSSKIRELERKIKHQKLINEAYIDAAQKDKEKKEGDGKSMRIATIAIVFLLVIANIIAFSKITTRTIPQAPLNPVDTVGDTQSPESEEGILPEEEIPVIDTKTEVVSVPSADYQLGTVTLINSDYEFNFSNTGSDITNGELVVVAAKIQNRTFKAADYKIYLCAEVVDKLNEMMADFYAYSGKTDVMVNTAHRSLEQQKAIFDAKVEQLGPDQQIAQTPGKSEHHTGYAFDLAIYPANANGSTFINAEPYTWIYENCHKYGFILRYPEGKTAITGIAPESWHFRYVGVPHSTYMFSKNKTLEEYMTDISIYSDGIPLSIEVSETESYSVFHVEKSESARTEFRIPKNTEYKISGNNVDGFIVWYNNNDVGKKGTATQQEATETDSQLSVTE
ncbi:MAG: D-alanyl-D-alanine carboxypeptidase family protein [Clostridia bacterium]|nr:D-alanyl-D-alanine carboxypeptidase family protein [Clostridia bacterium]